MRIVCQKCSAAYAIDDKFVTPKGVRAQCPRCRHLQLVKRDDDSTSPGLPAAPTQAPPPAPVGEAPPPFAFDFSAPPPPSNAPGPVGSIGAPMPAMPAGQPGPTTGPSPFDFSGVPPPPSAGLAPPAPPPPRPRSSPVPPAPAFPVAAAPPPAAAATPFDFSGGLLEDNRPTQDAPPPDSAAMESTDLKCRSCGKPLTDPFDQALGTCDDCRAKATEPQAPPTDSRIERVDVGRILQPGQAPPAPVPPPAAHTGEILAVRSAVRTNPGFKPARKLPLPAIGGVVLLLVIGGVVAWKKPWLKRQTPLVVKANASNKAIDAVVQQWKLNFPELSDEAARDANRHVEAGEEHLSRDTTTGYADAKEEFEKGLVLDSSNDRAIAGWVLALAFGEGENIDESSAKAAEALLAAAESRSSEARLFVAHAHFLLARGANPNDVQVLAEQGRKSPKAEDKALAELAIGESMLTRNAALAGQSFDAALKLDPRLKRGYLFQARLAASVGRFKDAITNLEKRLELDPDQEEAAVELARILVDVGETARAKKVLEKAHQTVPKSAHIRMAQAQLAYQHLGDVPAAIKELSAVAEDKDVDPRDIGLSWVHLAAANRLAGDAQKASEAADRAISLLPDAAAARLQHFLSSVDKGVNSQARMELDALRGKLDKGLEGTLEGRLLVSEGRFDEAAVLLAKVYEGDQRRAAALLLAGAAAAKAKNTSKAWEYCLRLGAKLDPGTYPVPSMTNYFVRPGDLLRPAVGSYTQLTGGEDKDPNPSLCEGKIAYFSEDLANADKEFAKVISIDPANSEGYAFRALIASRKKDYAGALRLASRAVEAGRTNAVAFLARGVAQHGLNRFEQAKVDVTQAQRFGPALFWPRVLIADIDARQKNADGARTLLNNVLLADPQYREAKRVLYRQGL